MGTVLVVCCNPNIRKFYVDNLTVRGYPTIGLISMSREDSEPSKNCVLDQVTPDLVLMWGALAALEPDIENIRQSYADSVPIIVVSDERKTRPRVDDEMENSRSSLRPFRWP